MASDTSVSPSEVPFSKLKGQDRAWRVEDAVRTLKSYAALLRQKDLLKAARESLKQEIADAKKIL